MQQSIVSEVPRPSLRPSPKLYLWLSYHKLSRACSRRLLGQVSMYCSLCLVTNILFTWLQVVEETVADDDMIMLKGCKSTRAVTVLLRGANDYMLDEMDRSLHDAFCVIKRVLESGTVVPGKRPLSAGYNHDWQDQGIVGCLPCGKHIDGGSRQNNVASMQGMQCHSHQPWNDMSVKSPLALTFGVCISHIKYASMRLFPLLLLHQPAPGCM